MAKRLGFYLREQLILKITLLGSEPLIWRRIEVHSGLTLDDLHYVLQALFEWENCHLYQFLAPTNGKLTRRAMTDAVRYHMLPTDPVFDDRTDKDLPADEVMLGRVFNAQQKQIIYEYDFGDCWQHLVKVEKRSSGGEPMHIPVCLAGENAAPPEDSGGIDGYYHWLTALGDEADESHEQAIEWLGEEFDPTRFDLKSINGDLNSLFKPAPPKKRRKPK